MLHLQPGTADDGEHHTAVANGHLGGSNSVEFGTPSSRIVTNYNSFGNSSWIQSGSPTWGSSNYYRTSSNLGEAESGAPIHRIGRHSVKFGSSGGGTSFSTAAQRISRHHDDSRDSGGIEFHARKQTEEESGVSSPPLWKTGPPPAPTIRASSPSHHAYLSPTSRTQAIARGRQELMEMIRDMPESAYELSLKDLVEPPAAEGIEQAAKEDERLLVHETIKEDKVLKKKSNGRRHDLRSGKMENGAFLIKMFFPASLGSMKRSSSNGTCSKVSPKPTPVEEKCTDGDWWKKRFAVAGENDRSRIIRNSRSSSNSSSSSSSSRHMTGFLSGCWSFFHTNKTRGREHKGCLF